MVGPESPPLPLGASTFADPFRSRLTGHYHRLPAGTPLPDGLGGVADGVDANPMSHHGPTHHTIFPSVQVSMEQFVELFKNLPWEYAGKK
jgi:hypothetical protein